MVVQKEDDAPTRAPLSKLTKQYVVVKNHVRELLSENESSVLVPSDDKVVEKPTAVKKKGLKRKKELQKVLPSLSEPTKISESDLEELRTVYRQCKVVLRKIETKYGHLLNLEDNESVDSFKNTSEESSCDYCSCLQKKKIIFDENGQQIEKDCHSEIHICLKRMKNTPSTTQLHKPSIQIEYDNINSYLPNDLQELENILKDENIDKSYRQMVIDKIYLTRQEYLNEMKYERQDILKQLKENPDEVLDFKGTNLSSLHGYPPEPLDYTE